MYDPLNSAISIGDNLHMVSDAKRAGITLFTECKLTTMGNATISIGNNVGLNGVAITSRKQVEIGDNTIIAPNTIIVDSDFHVLWPPEGRYGPLPPEADRKVKIGRNVWIGMNATILKGVEIGDNSVIGAGSVVTSSIPANVIAAGNPAQVIKPLAPEENGNPSSI
jgi:acetyltransferase-like isoleucine patch superfamily enzyme